MDYLKYLKQANVPEELHAPAIQYFIESKKLASQITPYKFKAPFMMAYIVQKLPWEAESLPEKWWKYDNEVSINGDLAPWAIDPALGIGVRQPCPLDDTGIQYCYYLKGHHPRSKLARWIWMGVRNMCSKYAFTLGPEVKETDYDKLQMWGDKETSKTHPGVVVYELNGHWQMYITEKFGPFVIRRNVGVKLSNAVFAKHARASVVHISWSMLRAK